MNMELLLIQWPIVSTIGALFMAGILAYARLENKSVSHEKRIDHLEQQLANIESGLIKELAEVKQSLARIEGYLKAKFEE